MFWTYLIGILVFIFMLGIIVLLHEGGHFIMAKKAGILCYEFSIGMGPLIYQFRKGETAYSIRAIPIGGYVSMAGEEIENDMLKDYKTCQLVFNENKVNKIIVDEKKYQQDQITYKIIKTDLIGTAEKLSDELYLDLEDESGQSYHFIVERNALVVFPKKQILQIAPFDRNFTNKKIGERFMSVFAGPLMNFVLALVIFFIIGLCQGYPDSSITKLSALDTDSPAYLAGLREGDKILYVGTLPVNEVTEDMYFEKWDDISVTLGALAKSKDYQGELSVVYERDNKEIASTTVYTNTYINTLELPFETSTTNNNSLVIGEYFGNNEDSMSYKAGIRKGDILLSVTTNQGKSTERVNVFANRAEALAYFNEDISQEDFDYLLKVQREGETLEYTVSGYSIQALKDNGITPTGVKMSISPKYERNLLKNLYMPFVETGESSLLVLKTLKLLFADKSVTISDLSGPIGMLDATVKISERGLIAVLNWMAMISVNIGLLNILPLPALDGGRLAFIVYEAITKKRPNAKVENTIHTIGFVLLMGLFVFVAFNDVIRVIFK